MTPLVLLLLVALALIETLAAYIVRVHADFGKILGREEQQNLDAWEELVEPQLGLSREHTATSAAVLGQLALGLMAIVIGNVLFDRAPLMARPTAAEILQAVLGLVLAIVFCNHLLPSVLFNRTAGRWVGGLLWPIRLLLWLITPITVFVGFFFSVAALAEEPASAEEEAAVDVEALLEAGEEEGILEESDMELVRSAVEFGDTLVREVMTPRPRIFAVPETTSLEKFTALLNEHSYSRVPVFAASIDQITGLAFAHDLLQVADSEAADRTVRSIVRPVQFVPETKRAYELLREMQREHQHMRIVVDEYGSVAGLVTIEDLLEEIVGNITDEHEQAESAEREESGAWVVSGEFSVNQLGDLFGEELPLDGDFEATSVGGLVSEIEGRIPLVGEVVLVENIGLRLEVVASTDRRVERVRVYPPARKEASAE